MRMKPIYLLLFIVVFASCSAPSNDGEFELFDDETQTEELEAISLSTLEQELFDLVNEHRTNLGKSALTYSGETYIYAKRHNDYMISKGALSHHNFNERSANISRQTAAIRVAENVAKFFPTPAEALQAWLDSAPHKKTIEGDFTHATLSIALDGNGDPYYTQIFFKK